MQIIALKIKNITRTAFLLMSLLLASFQMAKADTYSEAEEIVDDSIHAFRKLLVAEDFAHVQDFIRRAKGVLIIPNMLKVGLFGGVEHGKGILTIRQPYRKGPTQWSYPVFYEVDTGSIGLQFGVQSNDLILLIMNEAGLKAILQNSVKLGGDVSISAWTLGSGVELATNERFDTDIIAFMKPKGFFGGFSLKGSWMYSLDELNQQFYGTANLKNILSREYIQDRHFERLYRLLNRF